MPNRTTRRPKSSGPVKLTTEQTELRDQLRQQLAEFLRNFREKGIGDPGGVRKLGESAHQLHMQLKASGNEPRHHKYMVDNRGLKTDDPEFYAHVHPVEDLLKYIDNQAANDDPEDQTIGAEFEFRVYCRRWGHEDSYRTKRTKSGWTFEFMSPGEIKTGRDGRVNGQPGTGLYSLLDHDSINYPEELPGYLEWLWERAAVDGLSKEEVQAGLTDLAEWTSGVERKSPTGMFDGFK